MFYFLAEDHSIIGIRSRIESGAVIKDSILMGLDDYETAEETQAGIARGIPPLGIGKNTRIERAIIEGVVSPCRGITGLPCSSTLPMTRGALA